MDPSMEGAGEENQNIPFPFQQERDTLQLLERDTMLQLAAAGHWEAVKLYYHGTSFQGAKLTRSWDTVLHMAVSDRREDVVNDLLKLVDDVYAPQILGLKNENGDTPLHLAAALGLVKTCKRMVRKYSDLMMARNNEGETPLFVAAFNGYMDAFVFLYDKLLSYLQLHNPLTTYDLKRDEGLGMFEHEYQLLKHCRRWSDGQTILHCAISREYFDLALHIFSLLPFLAECRDSYGYSALHILAQKPLSFRSGTSLGIVESIIYAGIWFIPQMNIKFKIFTCCGVPVNYEKCLDLLSYLIQPFILLFSRLKYWSRSATGEIQMMNEHSGTTAREEGGPSTSVDIQCNSEPASIDDEDDNEGNLETITHYDLFKYCLWKLLKFIFILPGERVRRIRRIRRMKHKHQSALRIMKELVHVNTIYDYEADGEEPRSNFAADIDRCHPSVYESSGSPLEYNLERETALLIAVKEGVMEMISEILKKRPPAIYDKRKSDSKNIVLIAVENRQADVYEFLLSRKNRMDDVFAEVDKGRNTALHVAATHSSHRPQHMPGELMQMHWEIKWYEYVRDSMPESFVDQRNKQGKKPWEVFLDTHRDHIQKAEGGGEWMNKLSQSCSVVASLIATVAYASATTFPGGNDSQGAPNYRGHPAFSTFIISAFAALCFSLVSLVMFLTILITGSPEFESSKSLPGKSLIGLTSLFISMGSILVSFCAGHFFFLKERMKFIALPIYIVGCIPIILIVMSQFPFYWNMLLSVYGRKPRPCYRGILP